MLYRAMLCTARNMLSQDVCTFVRLSVLRLSVTRRYCVETAKHVIKLFFTFGYPHHSPYQTLWQYSNGDPPQPGGRMQNMKSRYFRQIARFISEMIYKIEPCELETVPKLSNDAIFNNLERPLAQMLRSRHYLTLNISETIRDMDV